MYKAKSVAVEEDTQLFAIVEELTNQVGLARMPKLFYFLSQMVNAFATASRKNALIGITDGILMAYSFKTYIFIIKLHEH